jgi:hypothetical protein
MLGKTVEIAIAFQSKPNHPVVSPGLGKIGRPLQLAVAAVAETTVAAVLAGAPCDGFLLRDLDLLRSKLRTGMSTIAERLGLGLAARAPKIVSGFNFLNDG